MTAHDSDKQILPDALLEDLLQALIPVAPPSQQAQSIKDKILGKTRRGKLGLTPDFITLRAGEGEWIPLAPRVEMKLLHTDWTNLSRSFLLRLHPGATLPAHDHPADEECLVLEGEVMLGDIVGRAGDYHLAPKGLPHGTITSRTGALLFLRAGITEHAA